MFDICYYQGYSTLKIDISLIRKNSQVCTNFVQTYFLRDNTVKSLYKICTDFFCTYTKHVKKIEQKMAYRIITMVGLP